MNFCVWALASTLLSANTALMRTRHKNNGFIMLQLHKNISFLESGRRNICFSFWTELIGELYIDFLEGDSWPKLAPVDKPFVMEKLQVLIRTSCEWLREKFGILMVLDSGHAKAWIGLVIDHLVDHTVLTIEKIVISCCNNRLYIDPSILDQQVGLAQRWKSKI